MTIRQIIRDLHRCADQNEKDAKNGMDVQECAMAAAVAGEQRRMIKLLRRHLREMTRKG